MTTRFSDASLENGRLVETNVQDIDLNTIPSHNPLAFMFGIRAGQRYGKMVNENNATYWKGHGENHRDLAKEYLRGFLFGCTGILVPEGTKIRKGQERNHFLYYLNTLK